MPEQTDRLDSELDAALASYDQTSEIDGLEGRVLAAVTRPTGQAFFPVLPWAIAAFTAATGCWFFWQPPLSTPATKQLATIASLPPLPSPPRHFAITLTHVAKPRRPRKNLAEPKLSQFPAPFPLTNQERALLRLAASGHILISRELTLGSPIEPLQLKPLEIKPLE